MTTIIKDKMPQGITRLSISFIEKTMAKLELPDPYEVEIKQVAELNLITSFRYAKDGKYYELQTDGFSVGYYGEGPTGLKNLLSKFKMCMGPDPCRVKLLDGEHRMWVNAGCLGAGKFRDV